MMWCPQPCPRHGTCRCHYCQRLARFQTCQVPRCICCPVVACGIWIIAHLQLCCCGSAAVCVCVCVVTGGRGGDLPVSSTSIPTLKLEEVPTGESFSCGYALLMSILIHRRCASSTIPREDTIHVWWKADHLWCGSVRDGYVGRSKYCVYAQAIG